MTSMKKIMLQIVLPPKDNNALHLFCLSPSQCFEISGVKILRYQAPIYYGNRSFFHDALSQLVGLDQERERYQDQSLDSSIKMEISTVVMVYSRYV